MIVFINNHHLRPVEELHDILISGVEQTLCGIEINAELFRFRLQVQPGLEMWDIEGVADTVYVLAQDRIRRPKDCLDAVLDLLARCNKKGHARFNANSFSGKSL